MRLIDGVSLCDLCIGDVRTLHGIRPSGRTVPRTQGREAHGLFYVRRGAACFWGEGLPTLRAEAGMLVYLPKYRTYKMQYLEDDTAFVLVNFEMFLPSGEECALSDDVAILLQGSAASRLDRITSALEACSAQSGFAANLHRKELTYALLTVIYENTETIPSNPSSDPQIFPGIRLLEQTYLESLPISTFADACKMSVSGFRMHFRRVLGHSPVQYRNLLRIERARALLSENACTVSEAAYACGFENLGYFCKCYKRITGQSPGSTKGGAPLETNEKK